MKFKNKPNEYISEHNGQAVWRSRSVAVVSHIIFRQFIKDNHGIFHIDYVLLVRRHPSCPEDPDKWCLPCGFLDWDETANQAAIREVWEETGLNLLELKEKGEAEFLGGGLYDDDPWYVCSKPDTARQSVVLHYAAIFSGWELPKVTIENAEPNELVDVKWEMRISASMDEDLAFNHQEKIDEFISHRQALCIRDNSCELNIKHRAMLEELVEKHGHEWSANTYYHLNHLCMTIWGGKPVGFERMLEPLLKIARSEYEQLAKNLDKEGLITKKQEIYDYLVEKGLSPELNAHGWGELTIVLKYSKPSGQTNVVIHNVDEIYVSCMCLSKEGKKVNNPEEVFQTVAEYMKHECIPWGG